MGAYNSGINYVNLTPSRNYNKMVNNAITFMVHHEHTWGGDLQSQFPKIHFIVFQTEPTEIGNDTQGCEGTRVAASVMTT